MRMLSIAVVIVILVTGAGAAYTSWRAGQISEDFPASGDFVTVDGVRLHYRDLGAGDGDRPTVVAVHGASSNLRDLEQSLGVSLADGYRVVLFDRPGYGWSSRPAGEMFPPDRQARLLAGAIRELGIGSHVLVGHSLSGALAMAYALDKPAGLEGVLALAPATHPWPGGIEWYYTVASQPLLGTAFVNTIMLPVAERVIENGAGSVFHPQEPPEDYVAKAGIPLIIRPDSFQANARDVAGLHRFVTAQSSRYREIDVPLTIVTGTADRIVSPVIHSRALAAAVKGARLIELDGVGHMPHYVRPDVIRREIDRLAGGSDAGDRHAGM